MKAEGLLRESKLDEAVDSFSEHLKDNPEDSQGRTFLFELLCFRGDYDRASTHLKMLGGQSKDAGVGALLYEGALHAERPELPKAVPPAEGDDKIKHAGEAALPVPPTHETHKQASGKAGYRCSPLQ